jgi:beta-1,2-mannobiose phosphorylase / 1,2-beta-oligomannan phosphorylase
MLNVEKHSIILIPTEKGFESKAVLNPGVYQEGNTLHFLYRAMQEGKPSCIGYAKTNNPLKIEERHEKPIIKGQFDYESHGVEDAKIVKIDGIYYITYIAYDGINKMGALATSKDLIHFEKQGIITPKTNYHDFECQINFSGKNINSKYHFFFNLFKEIGMENDSLRFLRIRALMLFPRKINGKFAMLFSIYPGIQIVYFDRFEDLTEDFWKDYFENFTNNIIMDPKDSYEVNYIGLGCVPLETNEGWLLIYYGVQETTTGIRNFIRAVVLDLENPKMVLSRLKKPLFSPCKLAIEKNQICDMVFPTGYALYDNDLYIYYGVHNKVIASASIKLNELLLELRTQQKRKNAITTASLKTITNY